MADLQSSSDDVEPCDKDINGKLTSRSVEPSKDPDDPCFDWFVKALTILGHFSPSVVALSYKVGADEPFRSLTLWLEDRIIRSWDLNAREKLRQDFWLHINDYLHELEYPEPLLTMDVNAEQHWRQDTMRRVRVVYWLISCAVSEAYGETINSEVKPDSKADSVETNIMLNPKDFPLGFKTGDEQVDRLLTVLRLRFLMQLQDEQARLDSIVSDLQKRRQKLGKTKPLKSRRRR